MSDISNFSTSSSSKRRLSQIDDNIEYLTQEINSMNDFVYKTEFECCLMTVKIKREKVKALSAVTKSQLLLANMEVSIAESDLLADIERLRNFKRRKLDRNEGESQVATPNPPQVVPPPTTTTVSVQTTDSMSNKKNKARRSSSRKSPVDLSSDETVIIPTIQDSSASLEEASQASQTRFSLDLFTKTPRNKSDSEVSLSSSVKAEFNEPYTKTRTQEPVKKSPAKKHKSSKHVESKSKDAPKLTQRSLSGINKTEANLKSVTTASNCAVTSPKNSRMGDKKTACATYAPVRHNMGVFPTQPSMSTMSPYLYVNPATRSNMQSQSQKADNSDTFTFYGSKP